MALDYSGIYQGIGGIGALEDNWYNNNDDNGSMYLRDGQGGSRAVTQDDINGLVAKQSQQYQNLRQGVTAAGGVWNTADANGPVHPGEENSNRYARPSGVPDSWRLYAAPNQQGMYWGPADWEKPNHNDGFFQKDAYDPRALISEMPGLPIMLAPLAGAAAGSGSAAGGDAALAGGGEVGSGYAASAPGWAGASGATGTGAVAGTSGAQTLAGSGANDTLGGSTMFDDYGNPLDMGSSPNVGDPNATGSFDQFGSANPNGTNPTGDYSSPSPGIQDYLNYLKQGSSALNGYSGLTSLLGKLFQTGLGVRGSQQQQQGFQNQANQYAEMGAPYRARLAAMYNDPSSFYNSAQVQVPTQQATNMLARSLSMNGGNPVGSGNSLQALQNYSANQLFGQFGNEANRLANFGGLSQFNSAAPGAQTNAITSGSNVYNALGAGASDIFNPQPSLAESMAQYRRLMQAVPVA